MSYPIKTQGADYIQCLQCIGPVAIITRIYFWTCIMIATSPVLQDIGSKLHPKTQYSTKVELMITI